MFPSFSANITKYKLNKNIKPVRLSKGESKIKELKNKIKHEPPKIFNLLLLKKAWIDLQYKVTSLLYLLLTKKIPLKREIKINNKKKFSWKKVITGIKILALVGFKLTVENIGKIFIIKVIKTVKLQK